MQGFLRDKKINFVKSGDMGGPETEPPRSLQRSTLTIVYKRLQNMF